MVKKNILSLFISLVFPIITFAADKDQAQQDYSEIEAAERQYIINELTYRLHTEKNCSPVQVWTDKDSGADLDGYFFLPSVKDKSFIIGGFGTRSRKGSTCVITVSEPENNPENTPSLLAAPIDWKMIWNDKGSGARKDGSMWEAIPPDSTYKCIGSIPQNGHKKPVLANYRCVHSSLTNKIVTKSLIWSDKGSNADKKVTMFRLPNSKSFVAVQERVNSIEAYDLKADAAVKPDPKLVEEKLAVRMGKIQQDLGASIKTEIEQKKQVEDERQKQLAREAEQKRLAMAAEEKKLAEAAEQKRLTEVEKQKQQAEEAKQIQLIEASKQEQLAEEEKQIQLTSEAEQKRLAEEAEQKQMAEAAKQLDAAEEPGETEEAVAVADNKNSTINDDNKKSSGVSGLILYLLKVALVVVGLFIFLGIIIYKFMKGTKNTGEG